MVEMGVFTQIEIYPDGRYVIELLFANRLLSN